MSKKETGRRVAWMGEGKIVVSDVVDSAPKGSRTVRKQRESKIKKWTSQIEKEKKLCEKLEEVLRKKEVSTQAAADRAALADEEDEQLQIADGPAAGSVVEEDEAL